jgi:flagellar hook-associated protein 1 FlgK
MGDLFTMLSSAARALDAQRYGLDVTGQNIANVNTPGYARRMIQFAEVPPRDLWSAGGGVDVLAVTAARAPLLEGRLRQQTPAGARESAVAEHLKILETGLGLPGASVDAALSRFYNAYGALAVNPVSSPARQQVTVEAQALAVAFREMAGRFVAARQGADVELRDAMSEVNALAREIADLNAQVVEPNTVAIETLRDRQTLALSALTELIDINVIRRSDGAIDVSVGNGRALVVGTTVFELRPDSGPDGFATILTDGADVTTDITAEITGGRIGGLLQIRDVLVPGYADQLDALAFAVATDVNALTTAGFDLTGNAGTALFVPPAGVAGAARNMTVNAAVLADSRLVVAASAPTAGNNGVAAAIAALQDSAMSGGSTTPVDAWSELVYRVSTDARSAIESARSHDEILQQLRNLRDQVSGVSLDEEAAWLMRFQRAYEANAKYFTVADEALELLINLVRT